jgi:hypothetical protein
MFKLSSMFHDKTNGAEFEQTCYFVFKNRVRNFVSNLLFLRLFCILWYRSQTAWQPAAAAAIIPPAAPASAFDSLLLQARAQSLLNSSALLVLPASALAPGRYEFTLRARKGGGRAAATSVRVRLTGAATPPPSAQV